MQKKPYRPQTPKPEAPQDFGDFDKNESGEESPQEQQTYSRVREPRGNQKVGIIIQRLGGNRMQVRLSDGSEVNCRVPGRFKRSMWLRPGDAVMIEPWDLDASKADVVYKYNSGEIIQLRKRGLLDIDTSF